ncbi:RloB family protein [Promicromonospora sp. MS192]|uniref:RloB family protein n=1 Tax=Promicromonospora sp. MS192 TaxID=3412684 RepID=UPI003C2DBD7E
MQMRKGGSVRRARPGRRENKKLLVVTEGEITEIQYVQGLTQHLRTAGVTVVPCTVQRGGGEPSRVLARARALAAKGDYEAVWLVVDVDDHATLDAVLRQCDTGSETVVVSNPQFEVWLLWHFTDSTAPHTAGSLKKELRRHGFVGACKHLPADFPFDRVDHAVGVAKDKSRATALNTRGPNPSSSMHLLVAALQGRAAGT